MTFVMSELRENGIFNVSCIVEALVSQLMSMRDDDDDENQPSSKSKSPPNTWPIDRTSVPLTPRSCISSIEKLSLCSKAMRNSVRLALSNIISPGFVRSMIVNGHPIGVAVQLWLTLRQAAEAPPVPSTPYSSRPLYETFLCSEASSSSV